MNEKSVNEAKSSDYTHKGRQNSNTKTQANNENVRKIIMAHCDRQIYTQKNLSKQYYECE